MCRNVYISSIYLLLLTTSALSDCPDGWVHHGSSCYHFSHDTEPMLLASTSCGHMGGALVEIESAAENEYLWAKLRKLNFDAWLGLNDIQEETVWSWYGSYKPLASTGYINWHSGEPDNLNADENCAVLVPGNGQWYDTNCHGPRHYICEKRTETSEIVG